jgi:capsular polysaccharide biosynthesis protein
VEAGVPLDVRDLVKVIFRRLWVLPVVGSAGLAGAYLSLAFLTPSFEAEARLKVEGVPKVESPVYDPIPLTREVDVAATIGESMRSRDLLREVARDLKLDVRETGSFHSTIRRKSESLMKRAAEAFKGTKKRVKALFGLKTKPDSKPDPLSQAVEGLAGSVHIEPVDKTDLISVRVSDYDPAMAEAIGDQLVYRFLYQNLRSQAIEAGAKYGPNHPLLLHIQDGVRQAERALVEPARRGRDAVPASNIRVLQRARAGIKPKSPRRTLLWLGGLAAGVAGGFFMIFLLELLDPSVRDLDDLRRLVSAPVLGAVPSRILSKRFEALRNDPRRLGSLMPLTLQIQTLRKASGVRSLSFASLGDGRDSRALVRLLAFCLSHLPSGVKEGPDGGVLFVESSGAERRPVKGEDSSLESPVVRRLDGRLSVASLGAPTDSRALILFDPSRCRDFLRQACSDHDLVLVEGPNLSDSGGFLLLNGLCDATVLVVSEGRTRRKSVLRAVKDLELQGIRLLGVVLNNQRRSIPGFLYHVI